MHHPFYGNLDFLPKIRQQEVKGNLVRARSRYIRETWGADVITDIAGRVDPDTRSYLVEPPLASAWVPAWPMYELDRAIVEGPMGGDVSRMRSFGRDIAKYDLPNIYRVMLNMLSNPSFLLRRSRIIFGMYFRVGKMACDAESGHAEAVLKDGVLPAYMCTYGVSGWFEASLAAYGVVDRRVTHVACRHRGQSICTWSIAWKEQSHSEDR